MIELLGDWLIYAEKFQATWEGEKGRCLTAECLGVEQRIVRALLSSLWVGEPWLDLASVLGNLLSECKLAQIDGAWEDEIMWGHRGWQVTKRWLSADFYRVTVPFRSNIGWSILWSLTESIASINSGKLELESLFGLFVLPWALSSGRHPWSRDGAGTETNTPTELSVKEPLFHPL